MAIVLAFLFRSTFAFTSFSAPTSDFESVRSRIAERFCEDNTLPDDLKQFVVEQFDSGAVVVVRGGADRLPGVARVDDDANGVVDDSSELGATGSDDACDVLAAYESRGHDVEEPTLVLQQGAYVPASLEQVQAVPNRPTRVIVVDESLDPRDRWSFVVELGVKN